MLKSHRFRTTVLGLTALIGLGAGGLVPGAVAAEVRKSENDSRVYRSVTLENSLRVLLVSDAKADKSAASLDVYVGSGADPVDRPGLAHFLEHMLFLGTKKYPEAGEYQAFITANGGRHNAYTSSEHTNYFFDIESGSFAEALDRFGQFFTAPLFSDEYVQREKHAVHSEYQASLKSDGRRIWEARQAAFNPQHPAAKFSVGSLETLADRESASIRAELLAFYERYYSANLMALTVISPATVDEQERLVRSIFSAVDNRDAALPTVATPLFTPGTLPARLDVIPIKDTRRVSLVFPIPALHPHYRSKPTGYLANLIGHEGKGSLLSFLLAKGWADGLSAGAGRAARDSATFEIGITLTREGMTNLDNVVESVFSYLALLRSTKPERWRFDEQARIADIGFRYKEFGAPIHYATRLSSVQHVYPLEDLLYGGYRMDKFDPDLITDYLERLRPDNVLMIVTTKDAVTDTRSKYFGTEYRLAPLPQSTLAKWQKPAAQPDLTLAEPNVFVPTTLELKTLPGQPAPRKLVEEPGLTLWYRPDDTFGVPKANYFVSVRSALANASPAANVMLKLYLRAVNESLKEYAYPVQLAGLGYDLYPHMRGFTVRISGYDPKQPELLERVIASLRDYELTPTRFADYVDDMGRQLDNRAKDRPSHQASRRVTNLLMKPRWTAREQRQALGQVTREGVKAFANDLLKNLEIVALAHGNLTAEDALKLTAIVRQALRDSAEVDDVPRGRLARLSPGERFVLNTEVDHEDSATVVYYQGEGRSFEERARFALLAQIISAPFYEQLRTQEQLGYVVYASAFPLFEVPGLAFVVQSPGSSPGHLRSRMDAFLADFAKTLGDMSPADFEAQRQGLLSRVLEKDKNLGARSERLWNEIDREQHGFDSQDRLAAAIRSVSHASVVNLFNGRLRGPEQRKVVSFAPGNEFRSSAVSLSANEQLLEVGVKFDGERKLFPEVAAQRR